MEIPKGPLFSDEDSVAANRLRLLSCFIVPLALSTLIALLFEPLWMHQAEDYLALAQQSSGAPSSLFRPPGYVAFLHFINLVGGGIGADRFVSIYIGQGVVLGLATVAWYITACRWMAAWHAWLLALAFGCNPLMVVLVGYVHYDILHLSLLVLVGLVLVRAFAGDTVNAGWAMLAGVACGAMTLIRPTTLIEPAFLALALGMQARKAKLSGVWLGWAAFSLAMAVTIAPRTWSNFARTGRFIPVNAQTMAALWPMFEEPLRPSSDNFPWGKVCLSRGLPLLEKQVGVAALDPNYFKSHPLVVEDVLGSRIRELIRTQPGVYFSNFAHNALFFLTGDSRMRIRTFVFYQFQDLYVHPTAWATGFFIVSSALLHLCGAMGLALGLWRRDPTVTILASLFICLWFAHSMVYLDYRYVYAKFPFMLWFTGYLISEYSKTAPSGIKRLTLISAAVAMFSLLGTVLLVF